MRFYIISITFHVKKFKFLKALFITMKELLKYGPRAIIIIRAVNDLKKPSTLLEIYKKSIDLGFKPSCTMLKEVKAILDLASLYGLIGKEVRGKVTVYYSIKV